MSLGPKVIKVVRPAKNPEEPEIDLLRGEPEVIREDVRGVLEVLARLMTGGGESVRVHYKVGEKTTQFFVECPKHCIGRLLGAKGATVEALRILVRASMGAHGMRAILEVPFYD